MPWVFGIVILYFTTIIPVGDYGFSIEDLIPLISLWLISKYGQSGYKTALIGAMPLLLISVSDLNFWLISFNDDFDIYISILVVGSFFLYRQLFVKVLLALESYRHYSILLISILIILLFSIEVFDYYIRFNDTLLFIVFIFGYLGKYRNEVIIFSVFSALLGVLFRLAGDLYFGSIRVGVYYSIAYIFIFPLWWYTGYKVKNIADIKMLGIESKLFFKMLILLCIGMFLSFVTIDFIVPSIFDHQEEVRLYISGYKKIAYPAAVLTVLYFGRNFYLVTWVIIGFVVNIFAIQANDTFIYSFTLGNLELETRLLNGTDISLNLSQWIVICCYGVATIEYVESKNSIQKDMTKKEIYI